MTVEEIFSLLDERGIGGMMFHQQMADYYDFLSCCEYKRLHDTRFKEESNMLRDLHCYYINHYCKLIPQNKVTDPEAIPQSWQRYSKMDISKSDCDKFILEGFDKWINWEKDTRDAYVQAYQELINNKEFVSANYILDRLREIENEIVNAKQMRMEAQNSI